MDYDKLKYVLDDILLSDYVDISEYQDKYFFIKKLKNEFPGASTDALFKSLDSTNDTLQVPRKKKDFISSFISEIKKQFNFV